jgi:hypothetical protein
MFHSFASRVLCSKTYRNQCLRTLQNFLKLNIVYAASEILRGANNPISGRSNHHNTKFHALPRLAPIFLCFTFSYFTCLGCAFLPRVWSTFCFLKRAAVFNLIYLIYSSTRPAATTSSSSRSYYSASLSLSFLLRALQRRQPVGPNPCDKKK